MVFNESTRGFEVSTKLISPFIYPFRKVHTPIRFEGPFTLPIPSNSASACPVDDVKVGD